MSPTVEMKTGIEVRANRLTAVWEDPPAKLEALARGLLKPFEDKVARKLGALTELPVMVHLDKLERARSQAQRDVDSMTAKVAELKENITGDILIEGRLAESSQEIFTLDQQIAIAKICIERLEDEIPPARQASTIAVTETAIEITQALLPECDKEYDRAAKALWETAYKSVLAVWAAIEKCDYCVSIRSQVNVDSIRQMAIDSGIRKEESYN